MPRPTTSGHGRHTIITTRKPSAEAPLFGVLPLYERSHSDSTCISNLIKITNLELGGNQIVDIEPLRNLENLTWLNISDNNISEISALFHLKKLVILNLRNNPINKGEISELRKKLPHTQIIV